MDAAGAAGTVATAIVRAAADEAAAYGGGGRAGGHGCGVNDVYGVYGVYAVNPEGSQSADGGAALGVENGGAGGAAAPGMGNGGTGGAAALGGAAAAPTKCSCSLPFLPSLRSSTYLAG